LIHTILAQSTLLTSQPCDFVPKGKRFLQRPRHQESTTKCDLKQEPSRRDHLDEEITNVIARRQPTARDLRLLMAASKCVTNLERAGDEARTIVKRTQRIATAASAPNVNITEIKVSGEMALNMLRRALDAFARMDTVAADQIIRDDEAIDSEFRAYVRKLVTYMMEAPRAISTGLDYLFVAKAIERIGDHATNIAESVVYVVRGTDIRHEHRKQREREVLHS
jgi:phosphate transport system protein